MKYDFDGLVVREGTGCVKYDARKEVFGREDVIPLWVADMDFEVAPAITEAISKRARHALYGYCHCRKGCDAAVKRWVGRHGGWEIDESWIEYTPGVVAGFVFAIRALSGEGDGVVIMPPVYPPFAQMIKANRRKLINNALRRDGEGYYSIDFEDLDRKLRDARLLLFCSPHNPTGRVFTKEELMKVDELCRAHNVVIISDEIHSDLTMPPHRHIHIASLSPETRLNTVTLIAPSKTFNVAGLSTSVAVVPNDSLRRRLCAEFESLHACQGNIFGFEALQAAYSDCDDWYGQMVGYVSANMDYVVDFIKENIPQVKVRKSEATYLMWLDFSECGMGHDELWDFLVDEARLGLNDGRQFGEEGEMFMRLNVGTSRHVLEKAMHQLRDAFARRGK